MTSSGMISPLPNSRFRIASLRFLLPEPGLRPGYIPYTVEALAILHSLALQTLAYGKYFSYISRRIFFCVARFSPFPQAYDITCSALENWHELIH